jgi:hypothetical protein
MSTRGECMAFCENDVDCEPVVPGGCCALPVTVSVDFGGHVESFDRRLCLPREECSGVDGDADVDVDADTDVDTDADTDLDADIDLDVDTDIDIDVDADVDIDVDADVDSDSDADSDADADADGGGGGGGDGARCNCRAAGGTPQGPTWGRALFSHFNFL